MDDFFNYILIHFDYEDYKIEIPNNLAQLNSSKFFIKEEKDRKEYLTINAKEIKEILKIILNEKKKLIYCDRYYFDEKNNIESFENNGQENQANSLYQTMKDIKEEEEKNNYFNINNNNGYYEYTCNEIEKDKPNIKSFNNASEIPLHKESYSSESKELTNILQIYQNNQIKFGIKIDELNEKIEKLNDQIQNLNSKNNILSQEKKNLLIEYNFLLKALDKSNEEKQAKIEKINDKSRIKSVELLSVPGNIKKENLIKQNNCFFYNFYPELNYSCYSVYECSETDSHLIQNHIMPNIYSTIKSELLTMRKNEKKESAMNYIDLFKRSFQIIEQSISLSSFSCSFLLLSEENLILINIGSCQTKKEQFNKNSKKWEDICLNNKNFKDSSKITLQNNTGEECELEIKIFPYNDNDKFFIMGNSRFWDSISWNELKSIIETNYHQNNSQEIIKYINLSFNQILEVTCNIDGISIVLLFLK